jgi:hypothetical protein
MKSAICKKKKYMNCFRNEILTLDKILDTVNSDCGLPNFSRLALHRLFGRAVAQAVRCWLPTAAARVRVRAACGVCHGQSSTGAGFLQILRFSLPIIPPISPSS